MDTAEWLETNTRWLEALDPGSGRVYFVDLPTQQSSWDAPEHFMDRKELATALQKAGAELKKGDDEAAFLAKVKQRFPPPPKKPPMPSKPPPESLKLSGKSRSALDASGKGSSGELDRLRADNARLQQQLSELEGRENSGSSPGPPPLPAFTKAGSSFDMKPPPPIPAAALKRAGTTPAGLSPFASPRATPRQMGTVPQWKRGASNLAVEAPPPPPPWALAMSGSSRSVAPPAAAASRRSMPAMTSATAAQPAAGGPLKKMGAVPPVPPPLPPDIPRRGSAPAQGRQFNGAI